MRVRLLAAALALAPLAGCSGAFSGPSFDLAPDRIGWNVTEVATFTLRFEPSSGAPSYDIDPVFAVESLKLDTGGVGGDFSTDRPEDLGFALRVNGSAVREHTLSAASPAITVAFRLPEDLEDATYTLRLSLFQAGDVESTPFRVNRP